MNPQSPISFARRHVLGDLYSRCNHLLEEIPVYLDGPTPTHLGHCDESLGRFRDAFSFHLPDNVCKLLSAGHYTYTIDYKRAVTGLSLISITLNGRKTYEKPIPRSRKALNSDIDLTVAAD